MEGARRRVVRLWGHLDDDRRRVARLWGYVVTLGLVAIVCLVCGHVYVSGDGMMSAAFSASLVAHLSSKLSGRELVATLLGTIGLYVVGGAAIDGGGLPWILGRVLGALGLTSLTLQVSRLVRLPAAAWLSERGSYAALTMMAPMFSLAFSSAIGLPGVIRSDVLDGPVFKFDRLLFGGIAPVVVAGKFLSSHPWLSQAATISYWAPQPLNVFVYLAERRQRLEHDLLLTLFISAVVGCAFYTFFPVVGPGYVLPGFPNVASLTPVIGSVPVDIPRNCMPSLHMVNALLIAVHAWRLGSRRWKLLAAINVGLTAVATIGLGYHYVTDLLVALPFTYGVVGAVGRNTRAAAIGGGICVMLLVFVGLVYR
jgi:PAP2 superfamily